MRAYSAVKEFYEETAIPEESWIKLLVGARLETIDGYSLLAYPMNVEGYKRLSLLLSKGNEHAAKGECKLTFELLAEHADHILAIVLPPRNIEDPDLPRQAAPARRPLSPLLSRRHHAVPRRRCQRAWPISTISRRR